MARLDPMDNLRKRVKNAGYKSRIVSIGHVDDLQAEIETHRRKGLLDKTLYTEYLASFEFGCRDTFSEVRSLIIVAIPQPMVRLTFVRGDASYPVIIPPTYHTSVDNTVSNLLKACLQPRGYRLEKVRLPEKLLAVRSGLARYGKNNITYVAGMGSFHRPVVFVSDLPTGMDQWCQQNLLSQCEDCQACTKACPSHAIGPRRFLLHAERCLTFQNERPVTFPDWVSPAWHHCLVGCMICQKVCPANRDRVKWIEPGATFNDEETSLILDGTPEERLPAALAGKLNQHGMMGYYNVLGRNLTVLMEKCSCSIIR